LKKFFFKIQLNHGEAEECKKHHDENRN